jgi:hypothetical protein
MKLTPRQQCALKAICDTFAPKADGWPSASELGVPEAIAQAMDFNPRRGDHQQFFRLLNFWDSRLHSLLAIGRPAPFSALPEEARVRVLLSWAESRLGRRRAAFQALRKAVSYLYVMLPRFNGARTPVWDKLGYPGPPHLSPAASSKFGITVPQGDTILSCDVCVVGSGAGGGTAAAVLAAAGKDVIVLEAGGYYDDADFDGAELGGYQRLYTEGGSAATADHSVGLLAGECLGGGTVVNYTTSFRTPDDIREEWAATGIPWFTAEEYTRSKLRSQSHLRPRTNPQPRPWRSRLARRRYAAQRDGMRSGSLRLLRCWLPHRGEAIGDKNLACRRQKKSCANH